MKRTHTTRSTGEGATYVTVKFLVTSDTIERAIMTMLDGDEKITKPAVEEKLRKTLSMGGTDAFGVGFLDKDRWYGDVDQLSKDAEVLCKALFPDFYTSK